MTDALLKAYHSLHLGSVQTPTQGAGKEIHFDLFCCMWGQLQ
jgi:hypothetical protein